MGNAIILGSGGASVTSDDLTAQAAYVLLGYSFVGSDTGDDAGIGQMPHHPTISQTVNAGGEYHILQGYHDGTSIISGASLASQTSGADANPGQVLAGKTGWKSGALITGTMPNNGAISVGIAAKANTENTYTIPSGYHNGNGKVTVNSLASQTQGTAAPGHIISGYTGYVNGSPITGTMTNNGTKNYTIDCGGSQRIPAGYHTGNGSVTINSLASQTQGTAAAVRIRSGYSGYVNGSKVNGSITDVSGGTYTPGTSNQTLAASGHYLASNIVVNGSSNLIASNIRKGVSIFGVTGTYVKTPCDIYNAGTFSNVSATWVKAGSIDKAGWADYSVSINEDTLTVYVPGLEEHNSYAFGRTAAITLTGNYTKLSLVGHTNSPRYGMTAGLIGVSTKTSITSLSDLAKYTQVDRPYDDTTITVNISGLKGTYYVYAGAMAFDSNHEIGATLTISRIYFSV